MLGGFGTLWLATHRQTASALHAELAANPPKALQTFTAGESTVVEAIAECIMPADEAAGAREAGVLAFIDAWIAKHEPGARAVYAKGLADLQQRVKQKHPAAASFAALKEPEQVALLTTIEREPFFALVRTHTIMGYLGGPSYGGNRNQAGWKAVGFDNRGIWSAPFGWYDQPGHENG